jgi:chorismate mutase/prephenate dehydratase
MSSTSKRTRSGKRTSVEAKLKQLRRKIDKLDRDLLKLITQRAQLAVQIGTLKEQTGQNVYSPEREEQVIAQILASYNGPLSEQCVRSIFRELMSGTRSLQKTLRVAYLGPEYSFSHLAAIEKFGESLTYVPVGSIEAVFEAVNRGHVDYGLVPIENSTDGRIADTLEMFTRMPLRICAEVRLRIHHNLLAKCSQAEIRRVYSRPQALSQCRTWLSKNVPHAQLIDVASTATAAKLAQTEPNAAAVASRQAAVHYELDIVASNIEDFEHNITRFAVIGDQTPARTGNDKTAIMFQIPHKPGALADALIIFKKNRVNLTWIESFPSRRAEQEYLFFVDFEGHEEEPRIKRTLNALRRQCDQLVVLGSFPVSVCYES